MTAPAAVRIAIFASGGGSNARTILDYFAQPDRPGEIVALYTNNPRAGVWQFGPDYGIPVEGLSRQEYQDGASLLARLDAHQVDLIVLAGYLKLVPPAVIAAYPKRILNIHPALLPYYGGRGMYGMHIHRAVIAAGEQQSGLTIHYVNEVYDQGEIIFQHRLSIEENWTPEDLQRAILAQEHTHFPRVIEEVCHKLQLSPDNG